MQCSISLAFGSRVKTQSLLFLWAASMLSEASQTVLHATRRHLLSDEWRLQGMRFAPVDFRFGRLLTDAILQTSH
jgi:hypothetical protein